MGHSAAFTGSPLLHPWAPGPLPLRTKRPDESTVTGDAGWHPSPPPSTGNQPKWSPLCPGGKRGAGEGRRRK